MKILLIAVTLSVLIGITLQEDNNNNKNEKKLFQSTCGADITYNTCCVQAAHIMALTSAAASACADTIAAVQSCASVAVGSAVSASVAACVAADVSVSQSVAISVDTGKCCEISTDVRAQAQSSANAAASAAAEAQARAEASASASAAAAGAAQSAAQLLTEAQGLVNSSCCRYTFIMTSALQVIGQFSAQAFAAANTAVSVASEIQEIATAAADVAVSAAAAANSLATSSLDNCCNNTKVRVQANSTANSAIKAASKAKQVVSLIDSALQAIKGCADDASQISNYGSLSDTICQNDCGNVSFSCCAQSGLCNATKLVTVCRIGTSVSTKAFLYAAAKVNAAVAASAYVQTAAYAMAEAAVQATAAAKAASFVSSAITVTVKECCSINVNIETVATARASAIATAFAAAKAAGFAYANTTATASALATSSATGIAISQASATIFNEANSCNQTCCVEGKYPDGRGCCDVQSTVIGSLSLAAAQNCDSAVAKASNFTQEGIKSAISLKTQTIVEVMKKSVTKTLFFLNCCCCKKSTTLGTTSRIDVRSSRTGGFTLPKGFGF